MNDGNNFIGLIRRGQKKYKSRSRGKHQLGHVERKKYKGRSRGKHQLGHVERKTDEDVVMRTCKMGVR